MNIENECKYCKSKFNTKYRKSDYCNINCRTNARNQNKIIGLENIDYVVCGLCSLKFKEINGSHLQLHSITKEEYDIKYGNRTSEKTKLNKDTLSSRLTPELSKKLSNSHALENYINKYGKENGIIKHMEMIENKTYRNGIKPYIDKYGETDGLVKYKERCKKGAMTLQNQIKLYGLNDGTKKYNEWLSNQKIKNTISYYINLYGYDIGLNKWFDRNNKISIANSKIDITLKDDYKKYCISVDKLTRVSLQLYDLKNIELRGFKNGYDLDHRVSKIYGFKNNIDAHVIAHISNLEIVTSSENRIKQHNSNLDINYILNECKKDNLYLKIIF